MSKKGNILVVDDDERTRRMMEAMLKPQGYAVMLAKNGKEGVQVARKYKPDFILMDMMMPEMDGFTACYEIKQNPDIREIPVFILTAMGADGNKAIAREVYGADGYLTKPVDLQNLLDTIGRYLPVG